MCIPGVLSTANLKNVLRDSKPGLQLALQTPEFMTWRLTSHMADRELDVLARWLAALNIAWSRLARDLESPITWDEWQGHYRLEDQHNEIVLHSLRSDARVLLKPAHPQMFTRVAASDPSVRQNFSVERASFMTLRLHELLGLPRHREVTAHRDASSCTIGLEQRRVCSGSCALRLGGCSAFSSVQWLFLVGSGRHVVSSKCRRPPDPACQ